MKDPDVVYQYLTYSAFKNMIENKTIKLSDIRHSNDTTELSLVYEVIKQVFVDAYVQETKRYKYLGEIVSVEDFRVFLTNEVRHLDKMDSLLHTQFVSCFSKESDRLSLWRGYSEDYKPDNVSVGGVSVGYNVPILRMLETNEATGLFSFGKVQYALKKQKSLLRKQIDKEIAKIRLFVKENKGISGYDTVQLQMFYEELIIRTGAYIKNSFFREEAEWRLCHWDSNIVLLKQYHLFDGRELLSNEDFYEKYKDLQEKNLALDEETTMNDNPEIAKEKDTIPTQYFYLYMKEDISRYISEVIIGPKCSKSIEDVRTFLEENGINCPVRLSAGYNVFVESQNH